ncbi:hypothetical protein ACUS53_26870, partial [Pseudomonas aeruginosa]
SRVFVSPLATPFHSLVSIFPIPSRYISIFRAPPPRYFSPSLTIIRSFVHEDRVLADPHSAPWRRSLAQTLAAGMESLMR